MFNQILVLSCVLSAAYASVVPVAAPLVAAPVAPLARVADYDPIPQYSFGYDVQDSLTGDYKGHQESRNGDVVQGSYSVVDPDGTRRIVDYAADPINGFNAVVRREPLVARAAVPVAPVAPVAPLAPFAPAPVFPPARLASPPLFYPF